MRKNVFKVMVMMLFVFVASTTVSKAQMVIDKIDLTIFPAAEKGYKKMVIEVPYSENDKNKKIEFSVGKWMEVDGCNNFRSTLDASGRTVSARTGEVARRVDVIRPSPMLRFDMCICAPKGVRLGGRRAPGRGGKLDRASDGAPNNHSHYCLNADYDMRRIRNWA